ncbi:MAG: sugar phosphate isomerase/epimerase, partial [Planctomycetes bacterium]|nr:sugar phosphate isomerase/epimerase [Planctomycetota bacterium]
MIIAASTRSFSELSFEDVCNRLTDLEYDKVELWFSEESNQLKPSEIASDPEKFLIRYKETTRLTPVAMYLEENVETSVLAGLSKLAKLLRVTQITIPASPLGTPFNTEIDRLRSFLKITNPDGISVSLKTKTGFLTEDPHTAVELCQSVKGLGLTLDPSYYICGPNRDQGYDQVFPHVFHVHLRDTTSAQLQVQIGLGEIDYSRLINQLERENYNRVLSVDILPMTENPDERLLQ